MNKNEYKLLRKVDENGYFLEDVYTNQIAEDLVDVAIPYGMFKPKWTGSEWIDEEAYKRAELDAVAYIDQRRSEYPPVEDYLDAIVKGDEEQKQAYIDACLAVKAKYPKQNYT